MRLDFEGWGLLGRGSEDYQTILGLTRNDVKQESDITSFGKLFLSFWMMIKLMWMQSFKQQLSSDKTPMTARLKIVSLACTWL
jgi:hypothetical protein